MSGIPLYVSCAGAGEVMLELAVQATLGDLLEAYTTRTGTRAKEVVWQGKVLGDAKATLADEGICPQCRVEVRGCGLPWRQAGVEFPGDMLYLRHESGVFVGLPIVSANFMWGEKDLLNKRREAKPGCLPKYESMGYLPGIRRPDLLNSLKDGGCESALEGCLYDGLEWGTWTFHICRWGVFITNTRSCENRVSSSTRIMCREEGLWVLGQNKERQLFGWKAVDGDVYRLGPEDLRETNKMLGDAQLDAEPGTAIASQLW